ncbi:MAG: hypothetical protein K9H62_12460, partial [Bacteroidales bacterium]|nr:hypothetical protein [Bacteroidales bacterium]
YLKLSGLGELTTATIIGITVGVTLALSAAAYIIVKPKYDESQVNLKLLGETKKWIESLPPEVQTKVKADLEKQLDDAFNKGKTDGFFGGAMKILKPLAIGVVALVAFPRIIGAWGKNNQKAVA